MRLETAGITRRPNRDHKTFDVWNCNFESPVDRYHGPIVRLRANAVDGARRSADPDAHEPTGGDHESGSGRSRVNAHACEGETERDGFQCTHQADSCVRYVHESR